MSGWGAPSAAPAAEISVAKVPLKGGYAVFRLFDDNALLPECRGPGASGAIADIEHPTKGRIGYGTGCWRAGVDGYIYLAIKSFDDGRVRETRLHNSKFSSPSEEMPTGKAKALIDRVDRLNSQCRGGGGGEAKTMEACDKTEAAMRLVEQQGWCWGPDDAIGAERRWIRCQAQP
jgi:hypothetical protein